MKQDREPELYPLLAKWMHKHFQCFKTRTNVGTTHSRADVVGIRDTGGDNSGEVELIVIEVKRGREPFATAAGQAVGYSVYANRVYLADVRPGGFTAGHLDIASNLGVGLINVVGSTPKEILSSRRHQPITRMWLEMARKLHLAQCRVCGTFFETGAGKAQYKYLARENVVKAIKQEKGLIYWHEALADRKNQMGITARESESAKDSWQRRIICKECIWTLFSPLLSVKSG
jgi:hypothetical protein